MGQKHEPRQLLTFLSGARQSPVMSSPHKAVGTLILAVKQVVEIENEFIQKSLIDSQGIVSKSRRFHYNLPAASAICVYSRVLSPRG